MPFDYDILIAGAGPAGCAAAFDLARAGKRVLLLDRRTFPRPKACACGLTRKTLKALRYSVDPVIERVCNEIVLQRASPARNSKLETRNSTPQPQADKSEEVRIRSRNPICAMAVRDRFDDFCLQQTLAAGATLLKIETISALREIGGASSTHIELDIVINLNGEQKLKTLRAPVLIGADGSNGQTRCLAEALPGRLREAGVAAGFSPRTQTLSEAGFSPGSPSTPPPEPTWYTRGFALEALVPYAALPSQLPAGDAPYDLVFDFSPLPGGYGWLFPKGDHINIGVGAFAPESSAASEPGAPCPDSRTWVSADARLKAVTRGLLTTYAQQKLGIATLDNITGQHLGMGGHAYIPRGRVLLTGDAAGLVDPLTGEGIHSAIISGQAAAAAILESSPDTALATAYARHLAPLQQTLAFSHRAARAFYREPERGFRAMKLPFIRSLILKTYADGLPHTRLLTALAKLV